MRRRSLAGGHRSSRTPNEMTMSESSDEQVTVRPAAARVADQMKDGDDDMADARTGVLGEAFDEAFVLASGLHRDHKRKATVVPYLSHLMSVAALVLEDGGDEEEAIAGLLHDALEDCADRISGADIEERFGARVRELVEACTDTPIDFAGGEKPPCKARKGAYLAHVATGRIPTRVSLADKVHNARSILRDHRSVGESVWDRFSATKEETLWYYRELATAYRAAGAEGFLVEEFERVVGALVRRADAA